MGVGHRVVHGGPQFVEPVVVDPATLAKLERYVPLAPLHQPHNLEAIRLVAAELPGVPQVACFDTAFHRSIPEVAQLFALPPRFADAGVRRYGFHGLSFEYVASTLPGLDQRAAGGRTVVFHLGNGASMCAMRGCSSVAKTMGFTAGIGENQPEVRARICRDARWLGIELDEDANRAQRQCISLPASTVASYVIPTDEELVIGRHAERLLSCPAGGRGFRYNPGSATRPEQQ
ncbi:MAG: hypothetical protein MUO39_03880 [Steroidobacteraceae bacterium]|nr:hypothetical protein [Steroidobacteraceae bacterium]